MSGTTSLREAIGQYLALRRVLGFKLHHETWWLPSFVSFLGEQGSDVITVELALRWAQLPTDVHPAWWARRLAAVRHFARYHRAFEPRTEVPSRDLLPHRRRQRQTPHIYTEGEILVLMQQASLLRRPLMAATYETLIGLLAATGMRIGEAIALDHQDVDWLRARLRIRHSKFRKSRYVPVHQGTVRALRAYKAERDRLRPPHRTSSSFFVSSVGTRLIYNNVAHTFARLVRQAEIEPRAGRPPRLHDFRHSFTVTTVRDWYRAGLDVDSHLPALSTYLGHVNPTTTYWYLTATPELLALASERAKRAWEAQP
jgi:integrase/recombinase XerD